jgi:hypothetical protein
MFEFATVPPTLSKSKRHELILHVEKPAPNPLSISGAVGRHPRNRVEAVRQLRRVNKVIANGSFAVS